MCNRPCKPLPGGIAPYAICFKNGITSSEALHFPFRRSYDFACLQVSACFYVSRFTAFPLAADCRADQFSEGRALQIVENLAGKLPHRQVLML